MNNNNYSFTRKDFFSLKKRCLESATQGLYDLITAYVIEDEWNYGYQRYFYQQFRMYQILCDFEKIYFEMSVSSLWS